LPVESGILRASVIGFTKEGTVIKFRCQSCAQKIAVNDEGAGAQIHCPTCGRGVTVTGETAPEFLADAPGMELLPPRREVAPLRDADQRAPWLPYLAQWLSDRLTHTLFTQRRQLLDAQSLTTVRVKQLEERLAVVQDYFQKRLAGYQAQISELERQLELVQRENQQLKYGPPERLPAELAQAIADSPVEPNSRRTGTVVSV
jgi:predicted RNA-binding Zn-ribbon protein involved in translation (DUF1610 family)